MSDTLIKKLAEAFGSEPDFVAYNINNTTVTVGAPPVPLFGIDYVSAVYSNTQNRLIMSLTGDGVYAANRNKSGVIEIALMPDSPAVAVIEAYTLTGIPFPIFASDSSTNGTSSMFAPACKPVQIPEWRRSAVPDLTLYRFSAKSLYIAHGIRKQN